MKTVFERVKTILDKAADEATEHFQNAEVMQKDKETMQKHWSHSVVFTDAWAWGTDTDGQELPEEKLQQGELWAVTFRVGCYIVRGARRIYRIYGSGYSPETEVPADKDEIGLIKKEIETGYKEQCSGFLNDSGDLCRMATGPYGIGSFSLNYKLCEKLRDTLEISARHISNPDSEYTYICRAASARFFSWTETIESIFAVKECSKIPNEYASLIVHMRYIGDSFSSDTWYRLEPTGKITSLAAGLYGIMDEDKRFS